MIFNKYGNGTNELRNILGTYYRNNDFSKITPDVLFAQTEICKFIGDALFDKIEQAYNETFEEGSTESTGAGLGNMLADIVPYVQLPIAILAAFNMYRQNDISHEDSGRKVKIDPDNEKIPWEWQLKRDDEIQLDRYYQAVDRLIRKLDSMTGLTDWQNSDQKRLANSLFINNADTFDMYFPINKSGRMYMIMLPFIREAERKYIKPALGEDYLKYLQATDLSAEEEAIREYILAPIPLLAMSIAVKRLPLGIIPQGVVRNYIDGSQTMNGAESAPIPDIHIISKQLYRDAMELLDDMKKQKNGTTEEVLIPVPNVNNKYLRV